MPSIIEGRAAGVFFAPLCRRTIDPGWIFDVIRSVISAAERSFQSRESPLDTKVKRKNKGNDIFRSPFFRF